MERLRKQKQARLAEAELDRYRVRMHSLEAFMKTLCQRFARWYNKREGRCGPFRNDRYKSVLIEPPANFERTRAPGDSALCAMAAYIELNPIRAGLLADPKDYRWCSYAEALAGGKQARAGGYPGF